MKKYLHIGEICNGKKCLRAKPTKMKLLKRINRKLILLIFIPFLLYSCHKNASNGMLSASSNINDSKKRRVFVKEYIGLTNPYRINDTLSIIIKSAWLEHMWRAEGSSNEKAKKLDHGYQLIVITDKKCLKGYRDKWMIGINADSYFRIAARDALITDIPLVSNDSTLEWKVQNGYDLSRNSTKTMIGRFVLKVKN